VIVDALAGVRARVDGQSRALDEGLAAALVRADERALAEVDADVAAESAASTCDRRTG